MSVNQKAGLGVSSASTEPKAEGIHLRALRSRVGQAPPLQQQGQAAQAVKEAQAQVTAKIKWLDVKHGVWHADRECPVIKAQADPNVVDAPKTNARPCTICVLLADEEEMV